MKNHILFIFVLTLFSAVSLASAQQRLSEWVRSLGPESSQPTPSTPSTTPSANHKRIAFIFSQTHEFDVRKREFVPDRNIIFRVGNYIQVRSALKRFGKFDVIGSLAGPDLTKANVKQVFQLLAKETQPGDEIFIYWESHGATDDDNIFPDRRSEEADGRHEFLYLGIPAPDQVILDDEFAEMLLLLKERRVMLLMEACHSGGLLAHGAQGSRNLSPLIKSFSTNAPETFAEEMNELCGNYDYTSIRPLLDNIITSSASTTNRTSLADFAGNNRSGKKSLFFRNAFKKFQEKDIQGDHPNLSVIFSSGETENSYCPLVNTKNETVVYDLEKRRWLAMKNPEGKVLPVGAPVFALIVALSDTSGKYSQGDHTDFADVWKIAKDLIPANNGRIDSNQPVSERNGSQTPQYLNNTGPIDIRPAR